MMKEVIIYTDGSSRGNPGPGGYGVVLKYGPHRKELSAGYRLTTNNRMEILAAIVGLEALKRDRRLEVALHSDSRLLTDAINKRWLDGWQKRGWRKADKKPVLNPDLWMRLIEAMKHHNVKFIWVPGHEGVAENERCDQLAVEAAESGDFLIDEEYERNNK